MPTATRTIVFTDLSGYTAKVSRSDREGLRKILSDHEALVTPVVHRYNGRVVKNLGDAFMCLFPAATDALRAALDMMDVVTAEGSIAIHVGMATGDVEEIDGDAFGEPANLAARILSNTPTSEIWFGAGTFACMNAAEIPWEYVGQYQLKGLPGEQQVYRAVPKHRAWLPEVVLSAVKRGTLVRLKRGMRPPLLPPEPVILLEGFPAGSPALDEAVSGLPVLDPSSFWLSAYNIGTADRIGWTKDKRGLVIGTPEAVETAIQDALKTVSRATGSDTIVLDVASTCDIELVMCGLALPSVPLSDVVASYFYDLLPDGRWVNRSDRAALRVEVGEDGVHILAQSAGITISGRSLSPGDNVRLEDRAVIRTPQGTFLTFRAADQGYEGLLMADTEMRLGIAKGQSVELGREPNHPGLAYPDRQGQDNIRWCSGPRAARAKAQRFSLDRALAGRQQCSIQLLGERINVTQIHERCPTFILRSATPLIPVVTGRPVEAEINDLIVAGTTVVALRRPEA